MAELTKRVKPAGFILKLEHRAGLTLCFYLVYLTAFCQLHMLCIVHDEVEGM
jgi:hypothetical protein